jgi:hypothetical protein
VDVATDLGVSDFFERELTAETVKNLEVCDGEVDVGRGQGEFGSAFEFDFVVEVTESVYERIKFGLMVLKFGDGGGLGFFLGEGFIGVGLFFHGVTRGCDEDENDEAHHDENEASGKR